MASFQGGTGTFLSGLNTGVATFRSSLYQSMLCFLPPATQQSQPPPQMAPRPPAPAPASTGPRYFAVYDYTAADEDEVSFNEGMAVDVAVVVVVVVVSFNEKVHRMATVVIVMVAIVRYIITT